MNRRQFLKQSGLTAVSLTVAPVLPCGPVKPVIDLHMAQAQAAALLARFSQTITVTTETLMNLECSLSEATIQAGEFQVILK